MANEFNTMNEKISGWKKAKELCEQFSHLALEERIKQIKNSGADDSVLQKALKLLTSMDEKFDLIESNSIEKVFKNNQQDFNLSGKIVDGYELISLLGTGGMSSVYLARRQQAEIQKLVALKVLSPYASNKKYLELFNREQQSLSQLNHKNIVSFHHGGQADDGSQYLVMDYVEKGTDIVEYFKQHQSDNRSCIEVAKTIAEAMSYAHSKGIIHRDLKSANILMDEHGEVKIVDFGISLFADTNQTQSGVSTRCYTLDIASPEQIQGKKVDARTDVFSLGALLLELLTKQNPLPKVNVSQYQPIEDKAHIKKVLKESDLTADLQNIIHTAMHIDLDKRYPDMQSFANDLDSFLNHKPVKATRDSVFYRFKKLIARNLMVSVLTFFLVVVSIVALLNINSYKFQSQKSEINNTNSMEFIDALFKQADPFISGNNSGKLVKTLESIEREQSKLLELNPEFGYNFYQKMAETYSQNGNYNEALISKRKAIKALRIYTDTHDPLIISRKIEVNQLLNAVGEFTQSINGSKDLLNKLITSPKSNPEDILISYLTLSRSYGALSQLNEEVKIHNKAIEFMDTNPKINNEIKAGFFSSMAISQYRNRNKEKANELFERTIELYRSLPTRKKSLAETLRNYAATNVNYGEYDKAEILFKESVDIIKQVDPKHPTLASTYLRYASLLAKSHRLDQAEEMLNTAVSILVEANDDVELSIAYGYLAELALRKNNMSDAMKHILSANKYMFEQRGLDHPKTLKKYNLALWILLIEPYQEYAKILFEYLDSTDYLNSVNTKEYETLQVQKALFNNYSHTNKQNISVLSQYLNNDELNSESKKINWLEENINNSEDNTALVNAILNTWLLELRPDKGLYGIYCLNSKDWMETTELVLKMDLMNRCLSIANINKYEVSTQFTEVLNNIETQIIDNSEQVKTFVDELKQ